MAILRNGFFRAGFLARAYRKLLHSIYVNDLWFDLRLHAKREAVDYIIDHMGEAMVLADRYDLLKFAFDRAPQNGLVVEFGVAKASSLRLLAGLTSRQVHGFDSFGGLPGDWTGTKEKTGAFSVKGKLPKVPGHVRLHPGWFSDTLPQFLVDNSGPCAFIHVDCDIYTSTVTIFDALRPRIQSGTVIVFDEYFNYPGWRAHEYKAFQEFVASAGLSYSYIGYSAEKGHVAVAID